MTKIGPKLRKYCSLRKILSIEHYFPKKVCINNWNPNFLIEEACICAKGFTCFRAKKIEKARSNELF